MVRQLDGVPITMLGCDEREVGLAEALVDLGADLRLVGFPREGSLIRALHFGDPVEALRGSEAVIAPMSNTDAEGRIAASVGPNDGPISLAQVIPVIPSKTPLLIGVAKPIIRGLATQYGLVLVEMAEIDEIAVLNSIPTAEGAIAVAMENTAITIHNSRCLVLGLGRCGTTLAQLLVGLGAHVTVSSRLPVDLARAVALHCESLRLSALASRADFQIIFNTIPAMVLPRSYLRLLDPTAVIVDIASGPGGTDFSAARELGIIAIHALSLPGRVAPKTAADILIQTIPHLLEKLLGEERQDDYTR
ncbi:MAG: dipicolinate synthase subunit DpsA [Limnochordia bacterium]|jgi:dipicolinate synthase subunit A|nr:dipicolinate synthase subunit DpsA [Limnochordia bacterium]